MIFVCSRSPCSADACREAFTGSCDEGFHNPHRPSPPRLSESPLVSVPATLGLWRLMILLPTDRREWDADKLRTVLAHEFSRIPRRDALTQWLVLLQRAVFWFSPLGWWFVRHLSQIAEEASDLAALATGADRLPYAKTLLGFFFALGPVEAASIGRKFQLLQSAGLRSG